MTSVDVSDAWNAIRGRMVANWTGDEPIQYPNQPFTPPAGATWLRLEMTEGEGANASLGAVHVRHRGVIWIGVYVPKNTGLAAAITLAETAAAIFENQRFSGVRCWAASIKDAGMFSGWRQFTVTVPYHFDTF